MKEKTKKCLVVGFILSILVPIAYWAHINAYKDVGMMPVKVWVSVCDRNNINLEVLRCSWYEGNTCFEPKLVHNIIAYMGTLDFYFEINRTGVYQITVNDESVNFLITKRSPNRLETFSCESE